MAPEGRRQLLLVVVVIAMAALAYRLWPSSTAANVPASSNVRGTPRTQGGSPAMAAPDVHLEALNAERSKPQEMERNLFRFRSKAPPTFSPPSGAVKPSLPAPGPSGPPPPPSLPPIALKFIGTVELTEQKKKIAILSDGKSGVPIYGAEGETIEGRYKILKIGAESIEMAYVDGRGRQTIRLSGQ